MKLRALVGINIGDERYEVGDEFSASKRVEAYLRRGGYAEPADVEPEQGQGPDQDASPEEE